MSDARDQQKIRILIVDDEVDFTRALQLNLELLGPYEVQTVNAPTQAVEAARAFHPDVVILDVMMPGMRAEQSLRLTPALFLTAVVNHPEVDDWVNEMQGEPCLAKPVTPQDLMLWIETHLKK